ncbi:hypothetical protein AAHH67_27835 [Niallia circulans]
MSKLTFYNPILEPGADPWVYKDNNTYYFMVTKRTRLDLWKSPTLSGIAKGVVKRFGLLRVKESIVLIFGLQKFIG